MRLANNMAIVTGGGTGIGAAIAPLLAKEGAKVTIMGRREEIETHFDKEAVHHG